MDNRDKQIFFLGIGGIGMSALARYYRHEGYSVAGYDRTPSDLTHALETEGMKTVKDRISRQNTGPKLNLNFKQITNTNVKSLFI